MKIASFDVGTKNLAYCITDSDIIVGWDVLNVKHTTHESLCANIVNTLDMCPQLLDVDTVLIEKQPSRNNKMRIVEALLNAYFVIKGVTSETSSIRKVTVYSSKHKLGSSTFRGKSSYTERKKLGITRCNEFLKKSNQPDAFRTQFDASKKKDDLADSLLQALSYTNNTNLKEIECMDLETSCAITSRKPTRKQEAKLYSKSNLKYLLKQFSKDDAEDVHDFIVNDPKLTRAVNHWYSAGGIDKAIRELL